MPSLGLVTRSAVSPGKAYPSYRNELREDFGFACAYCTMTEIEASAVGFQIDHYQPQNHGGTDAYVNLYWSCQLCNVKKSDIWYPLPAQAAGQRFLQVDVDSLDNHFDLNAEDETRLEHKTPHGDFNIKLLELNGSRMRSFRKLRADAGHSADMVRNGLRAILSMRVDELPAALKAKALVMQDSIRKNAAEVVTAYDRVLMQGLLTAQSRSDHLNADPESAKDRRAYLQKHKALTPQALRVKKKR